MEVGEVWRVKSATAGLTLKVLRKAFHVLYVQFYLPYNRADLPQTANPCEHGRCLIRPTDVEWVSRLETIE